MGSYRCLVVSQADNGEINRDISERAAPEVQPGNVVVRVRYSSLNYKDALAATGNRGVVRQLPLVPGIDAAGEVLDAGDSDFQVGESVMVFHSSLGTERDGGYSELLEVPAGWVYRIPQTMSVRQVMVYGTAGFTAAQSIDQLLAHQVSPDRGPIIVTGATGGVGIFAVQMLSKLGFQVTAVTGKPEQHDRLIQLGASEILDRRAVVDESKRPLLAGKWAGGIDTVGGETLATVLRATRPGGCITACGLVGGVELPLTVYPFILRGVTLQGIDSAGISYEERSRIWDRLATEWAVADLDSLASEVALEELEEPIEAILAGNIAGRVLVAVS